MESPARFNAVVELGKRLVSQLELGDDLLAQWMAHDIASRIEAAERADSEAATAKRDDCARAILALWEHRHALPARHRPFLAIEPLMRTLAGLGVEHEDRLRYILSSITEAAVEGTEPIAKQWLELAIGLDYTARVLIQHALRMAAENTASEVKPWVEAAASADLGVEPEGSIVRFVLGQDAEKKGVDDDARQRSMRDKIAKLEIFASLATEVALDMRGKLGPSVSSEIESELSPDASL